LLNQLLLAVHYKRAIARDRLPDRLTGQQQEAESGRTGVGDPHAFSPAVKQDYLVVTNRDIVEFSCTFNHIRERIAGLGDLLLEPGSGFQGQMQIENRDPRLDHTLVPSVSPATTLAVT